MKNKCELTWDDDLQYYPKQKKIALDWISNFNQNKEEKLLFITGHSGIGKTSFARLLLHKFNYDIFESNSNENRSMSVIKEKLNTIVTKNSLLKYLYNREPAIIIDEIETTEQIDKSLNQFLKKFVITIKNKCPIILISNNFSILEKLKSHLVHIKLDNFSDSQFIDYAANRILKLNIPNKLSNSGILSLRDKNFKYISLEEKLKILLDKNCTITDENVIIFNDIVVDHKFNQLAKENGARHFFQNNENLCYEDKIQLYNINQKYFVQIIFENLIINPKTTDNELDIFLLSRKIDFAIHNEQLWGMSEYMSFLDIAITRKNKYKSNCIKIIPKIYSKISQYLYQVKTVNEIKLFLNINIDDTLLLSSLLLILCSKSNDIRNIFSKKQLNGIRRICTNKEYWKKIMRKWK